MFTRTSRAKRRIGAAVLAALFGSLLAFASPAGAAPTEDRLSGANRYATAVAVATDAAWAAGAGAAEKIVVVNGEDFPDGLAASALGHRIFLTRADALPTETSTAIAALEAGTGVGEILVVGGPGVVSPAVFEALDALNGVDVTTRVHGADRYATALAVAAKVDAADGANSNIVIATGTNFPDALAAGPLAIAKNAPILLNQGSSLLPAVKTYVSASAAGGTIYLVGGTGVIPQSVEDELKGMGKVVKRLGGANREATAVAIATEMGATNDDAAILVNRDSFADALGAGPLAALNSGSIMPVGVDSVSSEVAAWHANECLTLEAAGGKVRAIGGTAVVSDQVLSDAGDAGTCLAVKYTATLVNSNVTQSVHTFSQVGGPQGMTLTAVPGSAADGIAGNTWTIAIEDSTTGSSAVANLATTTLTVKLAITAGMTQDQFIAAWNALGGDATKYFTPGKNPASGAQTTFVDAVDPAVTPAAGAGLASMTQTITVTFNQNVDNSNAAPGDGTVLESADFNVGAGTFTVVSPLPATPGGASVYTLTQSVNLAANVATTTTDIAINDGALAPAATAWASNSDLAAPIAAQKLVAG